MRYDVLKFQHATVRDERNRSHTSNTNPILLKLGKHSYWLVRQRVSKFRHVPATIGKVPASMSGLSVVYQSSWNYATLCRTYTSICLQSMKQVGPILRECKPHCRVRQILSNPAHTLTQITSGDAFMLCQISARWDHVLVWVILCHLIQIWSNLDVPYIEMIAFFGASRTSYRHPRPTYPDRADSCSLNLKRNLMQTMHDASMSKRHTLAKFHQIPTAFRRVGKTPSILIRSWRHVLIRKAPENPVLSI